MPVYEPRDDVEERWRKLWEFAISPQAAVARHFYEIENERKRAENRAAIKAGKCPPHGDVM